MANISLRMGLAILGLGLAFGLSSCAMLEQDKTTPQEKSSAQVAKQAAQPSTKPAKVMKTTSHDMGTSVNTTSHMTGTSATTTKATKKPKKKAAPKPSMNKKTSDSDKGSVIAPISVQ